MTEPSVCAIILTANRPEMARQAVDCFRRQTYPDKRMIYLDTTWEEGGNCVFGHVSMYEPGKVETYLHVGGEPVHDKSGVFKKGISIGGLRNMAIDVAYKDADIIVHFDDDDYSHPNRISEQVALLQSSGADCVGYNSMLFWREGSASAIGVNPDGDDVYDHGEAWLYSQPNPSYALGTSLCYYRYVWEHRPFEATSVGEDLRFTIGLNVKAVSSLVRGLMPIENGPTTGEYLPMPMNAGPRMVARIHSGNTSDAYRPEAMALATEWKRVPEWDSYCRSVFEK